MACVAWLFASAVGARISGPLPPRNCRGRASPAQLVEAAGDLLDGFKRIGRTPAALAPVLTVAVGQFLQVLVIATTLVVITDVLGGGLLTFSGLVGAGGVGVFLGFLASGFMRTRLPNALLIAAAFVLAALALLPVLVTFGAFTLMVGACPAGRLLRMDARARRHAGAARGAGLLPRQGLHGRSPEHRASAAKAARPAVPVSRR